MNILHLLHLFEARDEYIIKNQGTKLLATNHEFDHLQFNSADEIVQRLVQADPTKNQRYLQWLTNNYIKKQFRLEDVSRIKDELTRFEQVKNRVTFKDLNKVDYHSFSDEISKIFDDVVLDTNAESSEIKVLYNGPLGTLSVPLTRAASCQLGSGTKWCTASVKSSMFDEYHEKGELYVWRDKNGEKYQFHEFTEQYMDAQDRPISDDKLNYFKNKHPVLQKMFAKFNEIRYEREKGIPLLNAAYHSNKKLTSDEVMSMFDSYNSVPSKKIWDAITAYVNKHNLSRWEDLERAIIKRYNLEIKALRMDIEGEEQSKDMINALFAMGDNAIDYDDDYHFAWLLVDKYEQIVLKAEWPEGRALTELWKKLMRMERA